MNILAAAAETFDQSTMIIAVIGISITLAGGLISGAYIYGTQQLRAEFRVLCTKLDNAMDHGDARDKRLGIHDEKIERLQQTKVDRRDCPECEE